MQQFILSEATKVIIPLFDEQGHPYTEVLHGQERIAVPIDALNLMEFNLKRHGSSLRGAKDSAKAHLQNVDYYPIIIPIAGKMPLVYIMTDSYRSGKYMFIALHQIFDIQPCSAHYATVYLYGGQKITIPVCATKLEKRKIRAEQLLSRYVQAYYQLNLSLNFQSHIKITFNGSHLRFEE